MSGAKASRPVPTSLGTSGIPWLLGLAESLASPWQEDTGKATASSLRETFLKSLGAGWGAGVAGHPCRATGRFPHRGDLRSCYREFTEQPVRRRCLGSPHLRT